MGYVFISYSSRNQSSADALRNLFTKNSIQSWMAPYDIPAGSKYAQVINQALKNCACLVLLLTEDAQNSQWVAKEVERAINYRKTIITLQLEMIILNDEFEFYLSNGHIIAAQKIDEDSEEMHKVLTSVISYAGQEQVAKKNSVTPHTPQPQHKLPEIEVTRDGKQYKGRLSPDTLTGTGTITYEDGAFYAGPILNGLAHGKGKRTWSDGSVYEGDFIDDKCTGKGKLIYGHDSNWSGSTYEGDFVSDNGSGKGKFIWNNGDVYEGDFINWILTGKGKFTYANGDIYVGDVVDGWCHGKGRYTWVNGDVYEGDFINGKRTGKGKYTWGNGHIYKMYEGDFVDGLRTGYGILTHSDGTVWEGCFFHNAYCST